MADKKNVIIIKKVEGDGHGGHHGGGWKVAYADFMTAMMAFFLLLWILAASDENAKRGLADYFTPSLSQAGGRGQGLLDGQVLGKDGVLGGSTGSGNEGDLPNFGETNPLIMFDSRLKDKAPEVVVEYEAAPVDDQAVMGEDKGDADSDRESIKKLEELQKLEQARVDLLEKAREQILEALKLDPKIADFKENLTFDMTPEGLLVQMVDNKGHAMFETGSAKVNISTRQIIDIISQGITELPYPIEISGHTDATPYVRQTGYDNWELSTDRANATRRVLIASGINPVLIRRVSGFADKRLLNAANPKASENRRIGILLLYPEPEL